MIKIDWELLKEIAIPIGVILVLFLCIVVGSIILASASCNAETKDIGYPHRWSFVGGCQIEVKPGQWIPLDNYYFKEE